MFNWTHQKLPLEQLGSDFFDSVKAATFPKQILRYWNQEIEFPYEKNHLAHFQPLAGNLQEALALRYHGHQFQHYNPDLGDGRGFIFAQLLQNSQWYDLGTKGSGQTPYSRAGDGRLTLKGAFREALATEMLDSLGVRTSKTLSFFETGENLQRNDEPSPTRSAVLTRYSTGHIRIGNFQRLAYFNQTENLKRLTSYCLFFYYPHALTQLDQNDDLALATAFLNEVTQSLAELVAQVMMAGFVHGVLNTDNINISGELFDYGPYRFLPHYDPQFTAAYFDHQGLYCFGRQPTSFLWALQQLALSLKTAHPQFNFEPTLEKFSNHFTMSIQKYFLKRLNLKAQDFDTNSKLLAAFFQMLQDTSLPFEKTFFEFHSKRILHEPQKLAGYQKSGEAFTNYLNQYEVENPKLCTHLYFQNENPCTLLIDEIEKLWKPIAENDDWSLFNAKLEQIRQFRGVY